MDEVWIFADWNKLSKDERTTILEMNVTDVVLGVAMGPTKWNPTFTSSQLIEHVKWITENGMRAHLMTWLYRKKDYIEDAGRWLYENCQHLHAEHLKVSSIMFDCEKHWHLGKYMRLDKAVALVRDEFGWAFDLPDLQVGVTGLAKLQPSVKPILEMCDYGIGQGYAVWFPDSVGGKSHFTHSKKYEPGNPEKIVHDTWESFQPGKTIMGLACYYEKRPARYSLPAMSQKEALTQSLEATKSMGYKRCAYWSLNHCVGKNKSHQLRRDFISIAKLDRKKYEPPILKKITATNVCSSFQWLLTKVGCNPGPIDGICGPLTMGALTAFRTNERYANQVTEEVGYIDMCKLVDRLRKSCTGGPNEKDGGSWNDMRHLIPPSIR